MIIIVDTNIIFSALLNPEGKISDIIFNTGNSIEFFSPDSAEIELLRHRDKLS